MSVARSKSAAIFVKTLIPHICFSLKQRRCISALKICSLGFKTELSLKWEWLLLLWSGCCIKQRRSKPFENKGCKLQIHQLLVFPAIYRSLGQSDLVFSLKGKKNPTKTPPPVKIKTNFFFFYYHFCNEHLAFFSWSCLQSLKVTGRRGYDADYQSDLPAAHYCSAGFCICQLSLMA